MKGVNIMNKSMRGHVNDVLSLLQILYQNNQISVAEKNELAFETKSALISGNSNALYNKLTNVKQNVSLEFRDDVNDVLNVLR